MPITNQSKLAVILRALLDDVECGKVQFHPERGLRKSGRWMGFQSVWINTSVTSITVEFWLNGDSSIEIHSANAPSYLSHLMRAIWTEVAPGMQVPDHVLAQFQNPEKVQGNGDPS